jgi:putative intracellular protease/amidase
MRIVFPLFDQFTSLDAIGPFEVLSRLPGAEVVFASAEPGTYCSDAGAALVADHALGDLTSCDVLVVPGGPGTRKLLHDEPFLDWVRTVHDSTQWTTSVCSGSLVLGAAGLLKGLRATSHWGCAGYFDAFGATFTAQRVVTEGKIVTAAGVSAGIDMALALAARIAGEEEAQRIQLLIEYDPQPPFDSGSPAKAPAAVLARFS